MFAGGAAYMCVCVTMHVRVSVHFPPEHHTSGSNVGNESDLESGTEDQNVQVVSEHITKDNNTLEPSTQIWKQETNTQKHRR